MRRILVTYLLTILSILQFTALPLLSGESAPGKEAPDSTVTDRKQPSQNTNTANDFEQATSYFTKLTNNSEQVAIKENWATAMANFTNIHDRNPRSSYAAASLFMLGRISYSRYKQFNDNADLDQALKYYQDVVTLFPWHQLADDSLFTLGRIQLEDKKTPQESARIYTRITTEYYTGDLAEKAMDKLKSLAKNYNTPMPPPMETPAGDSQTASMENETPASPSTDKSSSPAINEAAPVSAAELPNVKNRSYVLPVEHWSSNNYTRVVIKTSRPVTYREELLEKVGEQPRRLFVDLDKSYIEPRYRAPVPIKDGLLQQVRTAQFTPDTVRVVLDIESIESYKIYSLPDPFRVIVDVHGQGGVMVTDKNKSLPTKKDENPSTIKTPQPADAAPSPTPEIAAADRRPLSESSTESPNDSPVQILQDYKKIKFSDKPKEPAPERNAPITSATLSLAQQLNLGVRRIVLDPGHGGKDPGASAFGLKEKDIVLQMAKMLAKRLQQELGCEVILTRNEDVFISLEERTAIANANNADLFISLHLNAHPSPKIYGFETYYLNLSTEPEAIRVAALENATSTHQLSDLQGILSDIMKNSKIDESSRLANQVQNALVTGLTDKKYPQIKSLGVKQAPFYVLIGAEMPAILIEMAFISNKTDANQIKKEGYQDSLAAEIVHGIQKYIHTITASR